MADDKKGGNKSPEEKKETVTDKKTGFFRKFLEPIFDQATTEYTRPILSTIPSSVLLGLKRIGIGKILPILSIIVSGLLQQKETWWGTRAGDIIAEATAELRRLMEEADESEISPSGGAKESGKTQKGLLNVLLSPELDDELEKLLAALVGMIQEQNGKDKISEKEKSKLFALLNSMSPEAVYNFLSLEEVQRQKLLNIFFKKEKTTDESIKELKENLQKTMAEFKVIKEELLNPVWDAVKPRLEKVGSELKNFDEEKFGPKSKIFERTTGLRSWSKELRDAELAKH